MYVHYVKHKWVLYMGERKRWVEEKDRVKVWKGEREDEC